MGKVWIDFNHVKQEARFETILDRYDIDLLGEGAQKTALCPFHNERKPSFKVNLDKKLFHCFGCEAKGNMLDFVQQMEDCSLREAAELIGEWCGIELAPENQSKSEPSGRARRSRARQSKPKATREAVSNADEAPEASAESDQGTSEGKTPRKAEGTDTGDESDGKVATNKPLTFELKLDPEHPYLAQRGLSPEVVKLFGLGYCSRGVMLGRICIPIHNVDGELVAYAGRWPGDDPPEGEEKYKLPKGFRKSDVLYNLNRLPATDHIVIVEGYWSVFQIYQATKPIAAVVALMGRTISDEQIRLLCRTGATRLTLLLDGDDPGRQAIEDMLPVLSRSFFVHVPDVDPGFAPDESSGTVLADALDLIE